MAWTLQECIRQVKEEYPDFYPYAYFSVGKGYVFQLVPKGEAPQDSSGEFHLVDPEGEYISGFISPMELLKKPENREKMKHMNLVSNNDEDLQHSLFGVKKNSSSYSVRRSNSASYLEDDYLCHHGIKNQQWGVQNGPPYPLNKEAHNRVVKGQQDKSERVYGMSQEGASLLAEATATLATIIGIKLWNHHVSVKNYKNAKKESDETAKEVIGDVADIRDFSKDNPPKAIVGEHSVEDDMKAVNPNYSEGSVPGTSSNCVLCSVTYDLRRRGYDVTAKPSTKGYNPKRLTNELYEGARQDTIGGKDFDDVFAKAAKKYPEGSRGVVGVHHMFASFGHEMAWEIHNGKMEIIDAQTNEKRSGQQLDEFLYNPRDVMFTRTDHLKVRTDKIGNFSAELKSDWKKTVKKKESDRRKEKIAANKTAIKKYKDDHPGTKLTDQEILETLDRK